MKRPLKKLTRRLLDTIVIVIMLGSSSSSLLDKAYQKVYVAEQTQIAGFETPCWACGWLITCSWSTECRCGNPEGCKIIEAFE